VDHQAAQVQRTAALARKVSTMNTEQRCVYERVTSHNNQARESAAPDSNVAPPAPVRIAVHGPAGTGKSYIISAITEFLDLGALQDGVSRESGSTYLLTAHSGSAAHAIGGRTIMSALGISIYNEKKKNGSKGGAGTSMILLQRLQSALANVEYIFIDEKCLVTTHLLDKIDKQLRQIFNLHHAKPFGGR
jgi:hypothetical protein